MAPTQKSLASQINLVGRELLNTFKTGAELRQFFNNSNDLICNSSQVKGTFFLVRPVKGDAISLKRVINFL